MNHPKHLARLFAALAFVLSNVMCASIAYNYCALQWGGRYEGWSAPASTAFLLFVPYGLGIIICAALAWLFHQKRKTPL